MIRSNLSPDFAPTSSVLPEMAVTTRALSKRFGRTDVLHDISLNVPQGSVYALLGRNGIGKSTLLQLLLGLLPASSGEIRVLGLDPKRNGRELLERVGYIPERLPLYDWMTVNEILRFTAAQYRHWSRDEEDRLMTKFRLDRRKRIRDLSRGTHALLALVMAMSHGPELVLLDECTSGMDAIFRTEFDRSVIETLQESQRTVIFAGHQIQEMEMLCDWVGILKDGRLLLEMPVDELKRTVKSLRIPAGDIDPIRVPGELKRNRFGRDWLITVRAPQRLSHDAFGFGLEVVETIDLSLEQIFVALLDDGEPS